MSEPDDRVVDREDGSPGRPASWWDRRSPKHKKSLVMVGITAALLLVMGIMVAFDQGGAKKKTSRAPISKNLLTDADPRALGKEEIGRAHV